MTGPPPPHDVVYTKVYLNPRQWSLLHEWCTRPVEHTKNRSNGGMQKRRLDWHARMSYGERSILLTTGSSYERATRDDMQWIADTICNRLAGGFQMRISDIFDGTHPAFTNLPIKPRKR